MKIFHPGHRVLVFVVLAVAITVVFKRGVETLVELHAVVVDFVAVFVGCPLVADLFAGFDVPSAPVVFLRVGDGVNGEGGGEGVVGG